MKLSEFQWEKMAEANKGFCYDANPTTWDSKSERKQMEMLVKLGYMEKPKNSSGDKHGFYSLTKKGEQLIKERIKGK